MEFRKPLLAILVAASPGAVTQSTPALAEVQVYFNNAPPALRHELIPAPRRGCIGAPGYWDANRGDRARLTLARRLHV